MARKPKVLLVENEWLVAEGIRGLLEQQGLKVCAIVSEGEEAIRAVAIYDPDLILMDIHLDSEMDGIEAAGKIRQDHPVSIIFLTDETDKSYFERAKSSTPISFLNKPINPKSLVQQVELATLQNSKAAGSRLTGPLLIRVENHFERLELGDILYVKGKGAYAEVVTQEEKFLLSKNLREVADQLSDDFLRIHKSYLINLHHISKLEAAEVWIGETSLPIGKAYLPTLKQRLNLL